MKTLSLDELQQATKSLPPTWYPDLIRHLIEESHRHNLWREGGCRVFVDKVLSEISSSVSQKLLARVDVYGEFHVEHAMIGNWAVVHTKSRNVVHTGLMEDQAREIAANMRTSSPGDL